MSYTPGPEHDPFAEKLRSWAVRCGVDFWNNPSKAYFRLWLFVVAVVGVELISAGLSAFSTPRSFLALIWAFGGGLFYYVRWIRTHSREQSDNVENK